MTPIALILLACSSGDRDTAAAVYAAAVQASVDPALALAVACRESGVAGENPMGVRNCTAGAPRCIELGTVSLANRLRGCGGDERCALRRYQGGKAKAAYAAKVLRIVRFVRGRK